MVILASMNTKQFEDQFNKQYSEEDKQDLKNLKTSITNKSDLNKIFLWKMYFHKKKNRILKKRLKKLISHYQLLEMLLRP